MPVVSVIVPAYGHAEFILETLNSVFAQTFVDYELIVVNDGSPDRTSLVLQPLIDTGKIIYFEKSNGGVSSARNYGIERARGKYIALLDDDDLWPSDKLEWQVAELENNRDFGMIGGVWKALDGSGGYPYKEEWGDGVSLHSLFSKLPFISPGQTLIRRSAYEAAGGFDPAIWGTDDLDLTMRIAKTARIAVRDRLSLRYRIHDGNASNNLSRMMMNFVKVINKNLKEVPVEARRELEHSAWQWMASWNLEPAIRDLYESAKRRDRVGVRKSWDILINYKCALMHYSDFRQRIGGFLWSLAKTDISLYLKRFQ